MRKVLCALTVAATAALALPSLANAQEYGYDRNGNLVALGAGAVVGTLAGVGTYNAWWGSGAFASALPTTAAGAVAAGGVAGVGTVALIDAVASPCRGFHAMFDLSDGECVNGQYVGYAPPPPRRVRR
jgi:hypothetical protein